MKRCPWCRGVVEVVPGALNRHESIRCQQCGIEVQAGPQCYRDVMTLWNRRPSGPCRVTVGRWLEVRDRADSVVVWVLRILRPADGRAISNRARGELACRTIWWDRTVPPGTRPRLVQQRFCVVASGIGLLACCRAMRRTGRIPVPIGSPVPVPNSAAAVELRDQSERARQTWQPTTPPHNWPGSPFELISLCRTSTARTARSSRAGGASA